MKDFKTILYTGMLEAFEAIETGITRLLLKAPKADANDVLLMIREAKEQLKEKINERLN